jgi:hypothetical protein
MFYNILSLEWKSRLVRPEILDISDYLFYLVRFMEISIIAVRRSKIGTPIFHPFCKGRYDFHILHIIFCL